MLPEGPKRNKAGHSLLYSFREIPRSLPSRSSRRSAILHAVIQETNIFVALRKQYSITVTHNDLEWPWIVGRGANFSDRSLYPYVWRINQNLEWYSRNRSMGVFLESQSRPIPKEQSLSEIFWNSYVRAHGTRATILHGEQHRYIGRGEFYGADFATCRGE